MSGLEGAADGREPLVFSQRGELKDFAWLSLRNGLLNIITLTLYRFWGKTEVRRRLWATTYLNDEAFEYTGRGKELFFGFLLALAVLGVPFLTVVFAAQFLGPAVAGLLLLPFYGFLGFLFGFGRYTAFRYIATRTAWRGIRCNLVGSPSDFGWSVLGYGLLSGITFGWFWPAAERRLSGKLWHDVRFGDRRITFRIDDARKVRVYPAYALGWVLMFAGYLLFLMLILAISLPSLRAGTEPGLAQMGLTYLASLVLLPVFAFAFAPFHAAMLRSVTAGIGLEDVRFRLNVRWFEIGMLTITNILMLAVSLGLLLPLVEARTRKFLINRLQTSGAFDLDTVRQGAAPVPRTGEGLADAFGIATV